MFVFSADARNGSNSGSCDTCCCEAASGRPGEINSWTINYMAWAMHMANRGLVQKTKFLVEKIKEGDSDEPSNTHYATGTPVGTPVSGTVATNATPTTSTFTYALDALQNEATDALVFNNDGTYTYTPNGADLGYRNFWFVQTDANGNETRRQLSIHVVASGATPVAVVPTPPIINVQQSKVTYLLPHHQIRFPVEISPEADQGDVYRLTVSQEAMDCDCNTYRHVSCYDIAIGKCR